MSTTGARSFGTCCRASRHRQSATSGSPVARGQNALDRALDTSGAEAHAPQNMTENADVSVALLPCQPLSDAPPGGSIPRAGWPWRLLARAPTDPYVLALEHTVPQPADSPPAWDPEAIRSSYGDMAWNLDGFRMLPSIESAGRRSASLHRVLRGEFPCFDGTSEELLRKTCRLPEMSAHP